jgi:hypothetical protein
MRILSYVLKKLRLYDLTQDAKIPNPPVWAKKNDEAAYDSVSIAVASSEIEYQFTK